MTTYTLDCPFAVDPIHIFLFAEVLNAIELRSRLLAGDTDYLYAFLDADLVELPTSARLWLLMTVDCQSASGLSCRQSCRT